MIMKHAQYLRQTMKNGIRLFAIMVFVTTSAFAVDTFTATGGTVVSGYWNSTNTGIQVSITVPNNIVIKYANTQITIDGGAYEAIGDNPMTNVSTSVGGATTLSYTAAELEAATGFADGSTFEFKVVYYNASFGATGDEDPINPTGVVIDQTAPGATSAAWSPTTGTLKIGQTLTLNFTAGEASLTTTALTVNSVDVSSNFSDDGAGNYSTTYIIGDGDADVASAGQCPLSITLKDPAGNTGSAFTTTPGSGSTPTIDANKPTISSVAFSPSTGTRTVGQAITMTIQTSEAGLTVSALTVNSVDVSGTFVDNNDASYTVTYTVGEGNTDIDVASQLPLSVNLSDAAGNLSGAYTTSPAAGSSPGVDGHTPTITNATFTPSIGTLNVGDALTMNITAGSSETGLTAGTITVNGVSVGSTLSDDGGGNYSVTYTLIEGNNDINDAAQVPLSITLSDGAGNTSAAYTTSPAAGSCPAIDANSPSIISVVFSPTSGYRKVGQAVTTTITEGTSETGLSAGTMTINGNDVSGTLVDNSDGTYTVTYTVQEGDTDISSSQTIPISLTLKDAALNNSNTFSTSPSASNTPTIDGHTPVVSSAAFSPSTGTLVVGNVLTMTIGTNEAGLSATTLTINGVDVSGNISETGGGNYSTTYTISEGDADRDVASTIPISIQFSDAAGNASNSFTTTPNAGSSPGIDANTASVTSVSFTPSSGLQGVGDAITMAIVASEADLVANTITVNGVDVKSTLTDLGAGSYRVTYTIAEGNTAIADAATIPIQVILEDLAGNPTPSFTTTPAAGSAPGIDGSTPTISAVTFSPTSLVQKVGNTISMTISASESNLTATTTTINGVDVSSTFSAGGSNTYTVTYTVAEGNTDIGDDAQIPIAVVLSDAGGNSSASYTTSPASNQSPGVDANTASVNSITFTPTSGILAVGDALTATINASETNLTANTLTINSVDVSSTLVDNSDNSYTATYTVAEGNNAIADAATIPVSITFTDAAGNLTNNYTSSPGAGVSPGVDADSPIISGLSFSPTSGARKVGDAITILVTADATGFSANTATVNGVNVASTITDNANNTYTFTYTISEGDAAVSDAATIPVNFILADANSNVSNTWTTSPVAGSTPWIDAVTPTISSVSFNPSSGDLAVGDELVMTINSSETVLTATTVTINGVDVSGTYSETGGGAYTATYTIIEGNTDRADNATIPIEVVLADAAGNASTSFTSTPVATSAPSIDANSPTITNLSFSPTTGTLKVADILTATVTASESGLTISTLTINSVDVSGNVTDNSDGTYTVIYTIANGNANIADNATIPVSVTFADAAGNSSNNYVTSPTSGSTPALDANIPTISGVSFSPTTGTLVAGDALTVTVTASEAGLSAGAITINGVDVAATFVDNTDNTYTLTYTVVDGNTDVADNATIAISIILSDAAGNNTATYTTSPVAGSTPIIDANSPSITAVSFSPTNGTLVPGQDISVSVTASEASLTANTVEINGVDVSATHTPNGGGSYGYTYTISEGDNDVADNETIAVNIILADAAGNVSNTFTTSPLATNTPIIDANTPTISNVTFSPTSGTLAVGDAVSVTIITNDTGLSANTITINGVNVASTLVDNADNTYTVTYTISEGNTSIAASTTMAVNVILEDAAGNVSATYNTSPNSNNTPTIDATSPTISGVTYSPTTGTLLVGDALTVTVTSTETGLTAGAITVNSVDVASTLVDNADNTYTLTYTVVEGNTDVLQTATIPLSIILNDVAGNSSTAYTTAPLAANTPAIDAHTPSVTLITFSPTSGSLAVGGELTATITTSETGLTAVTMEINGVDVSSTYTELGGSLYQVIYTVSEGDNDIDNAATIPVNIILSDVAGNNTAAFTTTPAANNAPAIDGHLPSIILATYSPTTGTLIVGDVVTATITAGEAGLTAGAITINSVDVASTLVDNADNTYTLTYTIVEGNNDIAAAATMPLSIVLADAAGNESAAFTTAPVANNTPTIDGNSPAISLAAYSPTSGSLGVGDVITLTITAGETGLSASSATVNTVDVASTLVDNADNTYTFTYTIAENNTTILDSQTIPLSVVLSDAAGNTNTAYTTAPLAANTPAIDAILATITSVTFSPTSGILAIGSELTATITASETGLAAVTLEINGVDVSGTYSELGGSLYQVIYTVSTNDNDIDDAATIPVSVILEDASGNPTLEYTTSPLAGVSPGIDAHVPVIASVQFSPTSGYLIVGDDLLLNVNADGTSYSIGTISINGKSITSITDNGDNTYTTTYTIAEGDNDIAAAATVPISVTLLDAAGNESAAFITSPTAGTTPTIDAHSPTLSSITTALGATYAKLGDTFNITVLSDEAVSLSGGASLNLYLNSGTSISLTTATQITNIVFPYTVQVDDETTSLSVDSITVSGGSLTDIAGNDVILTLPTGANIEDNEVIIVDGIIPYNFSITSITQDGTYSTTGYYNSGDNGLSFEVALDNTDGSLTNGTLQLQGRFASEATYTNIGDATSITNINGQTLTLDNATIAAHVGYFENVYMRYLVKVTDVAGNAENSAISADSMLIDKTVPSSFSILDVTPIGGNAVDGILNATNSSIDFLVSIPNDATLSSGTIQMEFRINSGTWADLSTAQNITSINTNQGVSIPSADFTGISDTDSLYFRTTLTDNAGNYATSATYETATIVDYGPPAQAQIGDVTTVGGTIVASYWNASNTTLQVLVPIDNTDASLIGGTVQIKMAVLPGAYENVGTPATIDALSDMTVTITEAAIQGHSAYAEDVEFSITADISDAGLNTTEALASLTTLTIDQVLPGDETTGVITMIGGIVATNYWNASNTELTIEIPFLNTDNSIGLGGTIDLEARANAIPWVSIGTQTDILTPTSPKIVTLTQGDISDITGFDTGVTLHFRATVTDVAGNATVYSESATAISVDVTAPSAFSISSYTTEGASVVSGYWNTTNTGLNLDIPVANDASLVHTVDNFGQIQIQAQIDGGAWEDIGSALDITTANTNENIALLQSEMEALTNFADGVDIILRAEIRDDAGNITTSTYVDETLINDLTLPAVFTTGLVESNAISFWNLVSETMNVSIPIANDASLENGSLDIYMGIDALSLENVYSAAIPAINTVQIEDIDSSIVEHITGFAETETIYTKAVIWDIAGNSSTGIISASEVIIDQIAPDVLSFITITTTATQNSVADYWNSYNTDIHFTVDAPAIDPTLVNGNYQFYLRTSTNPYEAFGAPNNIPAVGEYTFDYTSTTFEAITGFTDGFLIDAKFVLTDVAGNSTEGTISEDFLTIDQTPPVESSFIETSTSFDNYMNSSDTLHATWNDFTDATSGIDIYHYASTLDGVAPVANDWNNVPIGETTYIDSLTIPNEADNYVLFVNAFDVAGNISAFIQTNGIIADYTPPASTAILDPYYFIENWSDAITGSSSDNISGVANIVINVTRNSDDFYWSGTAWAVDSAAIELTSSFDPWTIPLLADVLENRVNYTIKTVATDSANNVQTDSGEDIFEFVINSPPVFTQADPDTATEDIAYELILTANDVDIVSSSGDELKYYLLDAPLSMEIDSLLGIVIWTPTNDETGDTTFTVQVRDLHLEADTMTVELYVTPINDAPEIVALLSPIDQYVQTVATGINLQFTWNHAVDVDNAQADLTYMLHFQSRNYDTLFNSTDTFLVVDVSQLGVPVDTLVTWFVDSHDGRDTSVVSLPFTFTPAGPELNLSSSDFVIRQRRGSAPDSSLSISNTGILPLSWAISTKPTWLSFDTTNGIIAYNNSQNVPLHIASSTFETGVYTGTITFRSNDINNDSIPIPIRVEIYDKPELAVKLYHSSVYASTFEIFIVDSLAMTDSIRANIANDTLVLNKVRENVYSSLLNFTNVGNKQLQVFASGWAGDTTVTRDFTVSLAKSNMDWIASNPEDDFTILGKKGAFSMDESIAIMSAAQVGENLEYKVLSRQSILNEPVMIQLRTHEMNKAIYIENKDGIYTELPTREENGILMAYTSQMGKFSIGERNIIVPDVTELFPNYPNPFNGHTTIHFDLGFFDGAVQHTVVNIYNIRGQLIHELRNAPMSPGNYQINWSGQDQWGKPVSSGLYFVTVATDKGYFKSAKMVVLK